MEVAVALSRGEGPLLEEQLVRRLPVESAGFVMGGDGVV